MLSLIVLGTVLTTPLEVAKALAYAGYPLRVLNSYATSGEIAKGQARANVAMAVRRSGDVPMAAGEVVALIFRVEFATPKAIGSDASDAWTEAHAKDAGVEFVPHLGETATERATLSLGQDASPERLRAFIDRFFAVGAAYAKAHGATYASVEPPDGKGRKLDETRRLDRADDVSLRRAAAAWGWSAKKDFSYASLGWLVPIEVKGKRLWLQQGVRGTTAETRRIEIVRYGTEPAPADYGAQAQAKGEFPTLVYENGAAYAPAARESIDLSKGVALGELRRQILAFAQAN